MRVAALFPNYASMSTVQQLSYVKALRQKRADAMLRYQQEQKEKKSKKKPTAKQQEQESLLALLTPEQKATLLEAIGELDG